MKKTVVVLGVGRSGTSLTAGILGILGVDMGRVGRPTRTNPRGSFEDYDFNSLIQNILRSAAGGPCDYWNPPDKKKILCQEAKFESKIRGLVLKKSKDRDFWGWKFPQTSLVLELFMPYLESPCFVVVFRNVLGNAYSLLNASDISSFSKAMQVCSFHSRNILDLLDKYPSVPKIFVSFENLVSNPVSESKKLADFLGIPFTESKQQKIRRFVIPRDKIAKEKLKTGLTRDLPLFVSKNIARPRSFSARILKFFRRKL